MKHNFGSAQPLGELYIRSVSDMEDSPLGWAVCVLTHNEQRTEMLVLRHCIYKAEAFSIEQRILDFLQREQRLMEQVASPQEFREWLASMPG